MKIWVDDIRPAPDGYKWCKTTIETIDTLQRCMCSLIPIEVLDLDHDAGDQVIHGGDYIRILQWLEKEQIELERDFNFSIHIHSMNPVGIMNMRAIIQKNGWKEVW